MVLQDTNYQVGDLHLEEVKAVWCKVPDEHRSPNVFPTSVTHGNHAVRDARPGPADLAKPGVR